MLNWINTLCSPYFKVAHTHAAILVSHLSSSYCLHTSLRYLAARITTHYLSLAKNILDVSLAHRLTLQSFQSSLFTPTEFLTFPDPQISCIDHNVVEPAACKESLLHPHGTSSTISNRYSIIHSPLDRHNSRVCWSKRAAGFEAEGGIFGTVPGWGVAVSPAAASWWWRCCCPRLALGWAGAGAEGQSLQQVRGLVLQLWQEQGWAGWTPWGTSAAWGSPWQGRAEGRSPGQTKTQASLGAVCPTLCQWRRWELQAQTAMLACRTPAQHHLCDLLPD